MDFDSMDEIICMGPKDLHLSMIMKGKRTKRARQPSPASAVFTASSCSSGGGEKPRTKIRSSESLCSEISTSTEEDEDMANCLILLAQSGRENTMTPPIHVASNIEKQEKSSRRLKELTITTSSTIVGKAGIYVYECKTCNRSFPSFQALGGHRTSHKKHKPAVEMEEKKPKILPPSHDHHQEEEAKGKKFLKTSLLPLDIAKRSYHGGILDNINKVKIHECSICGAEFSSGQALGGHMRRHRNPTSATTPTAEASQDGGGERGRNILELDLNLPAPQEEDHHDSQFQLSLFSSPALVDCQ